MLQRSARRSFPTRRTLRLGASAATLGVALFAQAVLAQTSTQPAQTQTPPPVQTTPAQPAAQPQTTEAPAAQTPAQGTAQGEAQAGDQQGAVTITAQKPAVQNKVDRDVYDVKQDPQSATGTAADVLNNVPAVTVDQDGSVSLRGNNNVQVYVNGKKSAQMQGDNRAFSLQSMSGDDIDSVEVMTNPSAAFGSDSAGGIINIVMKRGRSLRPQTSYNVTVGDQGRGMVGFRTGKTFGDKLTVNANVNVNRNMSGGGWGGGSRKNRSINDRERLDPTTGAVIRRDLTQTVSKTYSDGVNGNIGVNYNLSDFDTLEAQLDYRKSNSRSESAQETQSFDSAGILTSDRPSLRDSMRNQENMSMGLSYDRRGEPGSTEAFKMQWVHSQSLNSSQTLIHNINRLPAMADTYSAQASKSKDFVDTFSGDWTHPLLESETESRQLQLGWNIEHTVSDQYTYQSLTLTTPVTPPEAPRTSSISQFDSDEWLTAAYATFERKAGKFGYQAGVRVENLHQDLLFSNPTSTAAATAIKRDTVNVSPSLFLTYDVSEQDKLKFVYSQKMQRPQARQLNPLIIFSEDGLYARSGNADLKPELTDKFEMSYNRSRKGMNFNGQLFYDSTEDTINQVSTFLPGQPNVLLTTTQNAGTRKRAGVNGNLDLNSSDRKYGLNVNYNYNYSVTNYTDLATGLPVERKGPTSMARARFQYRQNDKNNYQVVLFHMGERTDSEGYSTPFTRLNLSYQYSFIPNKAVLSINASGLRIGDVTRRYTDTSTVRGYSETLDPGVSVMASLRYTFGAVRAGRNNQDGGNWRDRQGGPGGGRGGFPGGPPGSF